MMAFQLKIQALSTQRMAFFSCVKEISIPPSMLQLPTPIPPSQKRAGAVNKRKKGGFNLNGNW